MDKQQGGHAAAYQVPVRWNFDFNWTPLYCKVKVKVIPQQAEVAQGVPGRLRTRIFLTFGTTRMAGRQPNAPAAFTPGEIPGTLSEAESTSGHMVPSGGATEKNPQWHHRESIPGPSD